MVISDIVKSVGSIIIRLFIIPVVTHHYPIYMTRIGLFNKLHKVFKTGKITGFPAFTRFIVFPNVYGRTMNQYIKIFDAFLN
jgi:hypothetical protein